MKLMQQKKEQTDKNGHYATKVGEINGRKTLDFFEITG